MAEVVAEAGTCNFREVKVGQIRTLSNGLCTVWLQCPLAAAIKVAELGKLKIGWTIARIELLKARATRCFKCWKQGHLRNNCKSIADYTRTCYRCGTEGHPAKTCLAPLRCVLCVEIGKETNHRMGSGLCAADKVNPADKKLPVANVESDRRTDNMDVDNG